MCFAVLLSSLFCLAETTAAQEPTSAAPSGSQAQVGEPASNSQSGAHTPDTASAPVQQEGAQAQPSPESVQSQPQSVQPEGANSEALQPQPQAQPEQGAQKTPTPTIVLDSQEVQGILGKEALSRTGEKMGQIVDVIVDRSGRIRAAIIDFGGFLGVGSRKIAVGWRAVHFVQGGKTLRIILDLTREEVVGSKEYKPNDQITILEPKGEMPAQENAEAKPAPAAPDK
ncbi:MAG: PRC-barrel domain-containing protein [Hyphomicrobiales bacterium]|nr:PRC-barrel domain-containing protein [Hyphomicrobiales bacterium]